MKRLTLILASLAAPLLLQAAVRVGTLEVEQRTTPLSIERAAPRLSWIITADERNVMQTAYHILVASDPALLDEQHADLWNSEVTASDRSVWVPYGGKKLRSNQRCYWKVKVYTTQGESPWSETAEWGMGLLGESAWSGQWIGWEAPFAWDRETTFSRMSARYLRTEFENGGREIRRATLHISGLGLYELYLNGERIGDQVLAPAPTDYRRTVLYNSFDVTKQLRADRNAIGVTLGNGRFYTMRQNYKPYKIPNFGYPKMRLNLIIEYADGTQRHIASDPSWRLTAEGPIRSNNEYDGEIYDANRELGRWSEVGYDDSKWLHAQRVGIPDGTLRGNIAENMKVMHELPAQSVTRHGDRAIVDFGQNMAGWVRLNVRDTHKGDTIRMRYAERLNETGDSLYVRNLRDAKSTDTYIADGTEQGRPWSARFSYHGFRYIEITGLKNPAKADFVAEVVYDDVPEVGTFECSNEVINTVLRNAGWGITSNYKGMPLDCPQRNERQPWLGDHAVGTWGEAFLFDCGNLYAKWTDDIREAQREDGCIPDVAPAFWNYYSDGMVWQSVLPIICEMLYEHTGNIEPLERNYDAIKRWMDHMRDTYMTPEGIVTKEKYGDWCVPPESPELIHSQDPARTTDAALIATAYYCKVSQMMARFATLLGNVADRIDFEGRAAAAQEAFNRKFLHIEEGSSPTRYPHLLYPDNTYYGNNTVTANLLPLAFDMVPEQYRAEVEKQIIKKIIDNGCHVSSGVCGQNWTLRQLSRMGRGDVAYQLASQKSYPSFGYMAEHGATTIWELWNGDTANPQMNSGNHVMMLGDLIPWFYRDLAGINPAAPAYKEIRLDPDLSIQELATVKASYNSLHGLIESSYRKTPMQLEWDVTIPCNTVATVVLPTTDVTAVSDPEVRCIGREGDKTLWRVPSGRYHFSVKIDPAAGKEREGILVDEFLYEQAPFIECHSATVEELPNGDLIAAFFGGTKERNPDVCIWTCTKKKGSDRWSAPVQVADGIQNDTLRYACWNPILFQVPEKNGELWLFYKVGPNVAAWKGYLIRSKNGGKTWSKPELLPEGFLGPAKNKPIYSNGRILCPASTEGNHWDVHFEYTDDLGKTWQRTPSLEADLNVPTQDRPAVKKRSDIGKVPYDDSKAKRIYAIQPTIIRLADGRLQMLCRTRNAKTGTAFSSDNGTTWSKLTLLDLENNQSGIDAVTLKDGRHILIYNNFETIDGTPKGVRTPLSIAVSTDGTNWEHRLTLEESPVGQYSYPSIIQAEDGTLHAVYTWRRRRIKHMQIKL